VGAVVNTRVRREDVPAASTDALSFHRSLPGYEPTPVHTLGATAGELGLAAVLLKDESSRLGLPAFKVLGASWAVERILRDRPDTRALVAASAGNHGRAVAHVARARGLGCRVFLPARTPAAYRDAIAGEGAEVDVIDGDYEDAVARADSESSRPGHALVADVGDSDGAHWVIDGYATLFAETQEQADYEVVLVPVGVGSLAAAAARHAAATRRTVIGVEPATAACLGASLAAGRPTAVATPGTNMTGLDCAEVSPAAWPSLLSGIHGTLTVTDAQADRAVGDLAAAGLAVGSSGAAALAGLRNLISDPACAALREATVTPESRVLLVASEGRTRGPGDSA
jgi:diaminopropionate ammonia-lyase